MAAGYIIRKKKISSLEALDIDMSGVCIRKTRVYGYWPSQTRKPVARDDGMEIATSTAQKPKEESKSKFGVIRIRSVLKVKVPPPPKLEKPGREAKAYKPSQDEIQGVAHIMKERKLGRVKATLDTREEGC